MKYLLIFLTCLAACAAPTPAPPKSKPSSQTHTPDETHAPTLSANIDRKLFTLTYFEDSHIILGGPGTSDTLDLSTDTDHPLQSTILDDAGKSIGRLLVHESPDQNPKTHIEIWIDCDAGVPAPLCDRAITFQ